MKNSMPKGRLTWAAGAGALLLGSFLLCRYAFFHLHGMREWPFNLFVLGLAALVIAWIFDARGTMTATAAGYPLGFALGILLGREGTDPAGGATHNGWILWTACFFAAIFGGILWDLTRRHRARKR